MVSAAPGDRKLCTLSAVLFIAVALLSIRTICAYNDEAEQEGQLWRSSAGAKPSSAHNRYYPYFRDFCWQKGHPAVMKT